MSIVFNRLSPSVDAATRIASAGFVQPVSDALRADVDNHLSHGEIVFSIDDASKGTTVGFAILSDLGESVLYLSGIILDPAYQGMGIAAKAVAEARSLTGAKYLALRTQSARMYSAGSKMTERWFPHPTLETPNEIRAIAERAAAAAGSVFPVNHGIYGGPLYGEKPVHHDSELQAWWDSICDFERGDAVFCVGTLAPTRESS